MSPKRFHKTLNLKTVSIKTKILIPLTLAFVLMLCAFIITIYLVEYDEIDNDVKKSLESVNNLFKELLILETRTTAIPVEMIIENRQIQAAWSAKDRVTLLRLTSPFLAKLQTKYHITHLYFHDINRVNFLRTHKPEMHGDIINRFTILKAEKSGQTAAGIELGRLGTFTLRVVHPWRVNGKLVGYIEIGEEIEYIIKKVKSILDVDVYVSIYKKFLVHKTWSEGMKMLGRKSNWDQLSGSVIVSKTNNVIPEAFDDFLNEGHHGYMQMAKDIKLSINELPYRVGCIGLLDAGEREVGDMVVLFDVTKQVSNANDSILTISIISIALGTLLFVLFSKILGHVEKELEEHQQHLETLVKKRTEELKQTYNQLLHAEKLGAIGKLSASITHEFGNPIYGIINVLNGIKANVFLNKTDETLVNMAIRECDRISELLKDLQDFSRPTSGVMAPMNIHEAIKSTLLIYKKEFAKRKIRIEKHYAHDIPDILAINDQIKQVILNLVNNAEEAIPKSGGTITITTEHIGKEVVLHIKDSGVGIKPKDKDRIFEPFFTTKSAVKGTGLGLSVVHGVINSHGGMIEVTSEENKGATFSITLPIEGESK